MLPDELTALLAQTTVITERHNYLYLGGRRVEISPSAALAGLALVALALVAAITGFLIYRSRIKKRARE